jgi:hypothetical protein
MTIQAHLVFNWEPIALAADFVILQLSSLLLMSRKGSSKAGLQISHGAWLLTFNAKD